MEDNFDDEGLELESWTPEDWTPNPEFIGKLKKPALRGLAKRINRLWKDLSRKIKEDVKAHPSLYSIIYVPNGFIVPGGKLTCTVLTIYFLDPEMKPPFVLTRAFLVLWCRFCMNICAANQSFYSFVQIIRL